ncbi:uncharacterized protein M6D78_007003 [Vipera latastei]
MEEDTPSSPPATPQRPAEEKSGEWQKELPIEEQERWQLAMEKEMQSLKQLKVFTPQQPPKERKVIGTRWVYKAKPLANGLYLYKARLVAQGFAQRYMEDYSETYSPTVRPESVKAALVTAAALGEEVFQFDIQTAYLHANLDRQIYCRKSLNGSVPSSSVVLSSIQITICGLVGSGGC